MQKYFFYFQNGKKNKTAGIELSRYIRSIDKMIPIIVESTENQNKTGADEVQAAFINKLSKTFNIELTPELLVV